MPPSPYNATCLSPLLDCRTKSSFCRTSFRPTNDRFCWNGIWMIRSSLVRRFGFRYKWSLLRGAWYTEPPGGQVSHNSDDWIYALTRRNRFDSITPAFSNCTYYQLQTNVRRITVSTHFSVVKAGQWDLSFCRSPDEPAMVINNLNTDEDSVGRLQF